MSSLQLSVWQHVYVTPLKVPGVQVAAHAKMVALLPVEMVPVNFLILNYLKKKIFIYFF